MGALRVKGKSLRSFCRTRDGNRAREVDLQTEPPTAPSDQPGAHKWPAHQVSRDGCGDECIRAIDQDPTDN